MTEFAFQGEELNVEFRRRADWGAIWSGVFIFTAIWAVFGSLGMAIFSSTAGPRTPELGLGAGIWAVVLTIIAMYVAGLETGRLAGVADRRDGIVHGTTMFGLAIAVLLVLMMLAGNLVGANDAARNASTVSASSLTAFAGLGWAGFIGLFLGWLAAMAGAASAVVEPRARNVREIRPAA